MYKTIIVKKKTDEKLMLCWEEYLRHHPEMKYYKLSRDALIDIIAEYYLKY